MQDDQVIIKIKNGSEPAFKLLFEKYYSPLCAYLKSFTKDFDTAEEIAQETFVKFWKKREEIKIHTSVKSYLFKMGYHLFLKRKRIKKKQQSLLEELKYQALGEEEQRPQKQLDEAAKKLKEIIATLPPRCQEVLQLRMQDYTYREIAEMLNVSIKTVESQMRIAYIKIREGFNDGSVPI